MKESRTTLNIKAPAKLNLRLKVTGVRPDGYHELVSVMVPVDLLDSLELCITGSPTKNLVSGGYEVPVDETNLVLRAIEAFQEGSGINCGVNLRLQKNIPVAAGLGGGSSDAAAALLGMNEITGRPLSPGKLRDLAAKLGADVPFFLGCIPAIAQGIGDILEPIEQWRKHWYVIVTPPIHVSTAWVYRNYRLNDLTKDEYRYIKERLDTDFIAHILENDLETVTSLSFPTIEDIKRRLLELGAAGVLMSGSGPSVFGVFDQKQMALGARKRLVSLKLGDVFVVTEWERQSHDL